MGALSSRQNAAVEVADVSLNHAYKYPSRTGNYFGSHFIMGGERFDTPQPEAYLFGENADLNFLGNRPTPFPYPPPQANEPTKTLKSLVNIRKESVRFVKAAIDSATETAPVKLNGDNAIAVPIKASNSFNIQFTFDADTRCAITIYYFCTEELGPNGLTYVNRDAAMTSEAYHFKKGENQLFSQTSHIFNPSLFTEDDLQYNSEKDVFPIAIHCVVDEGADEIRQSHTTICVVDHHTDGTYALRALKQKIFVDGLCYLLQEIYGIENKNINKSTADEDTEDNSSECVICMSLTRDTLILPCRHLCLCKACADSLRYQANNCPICRAPFRALLQIRAVQKGNALPVVGQPQSPQEDYENLPPGYIPVALIEALNGPSTFTARPNPVSTDDQTETVEPETVQVADVLNRRSGSFRNIEKSPKDKENPPEFRMSVLLSKEESSSNENSTKQSPGGTLTRTLSGREKATTTVKLVNEKNGLNYSESQENDEDSDTEKLSPLLQQKATVKSVTPSAAPLHIAGVEESIDDTDTDLDEVEQESKKSQFSKNRFRPGEETNEGAVLAAAEDSDYYSPEDPHTTFFSPLFKEQANSTESIKLKENVSVSVISSPLAMLKESTLTSLPDSPVSGNSTASTRSSGDSYSSSSSTRQLLSTVPPEPQSINMMGNRSSADTIRMPDGKKMGHDNIVNV